MFIQTMNNMFQFNNAIHKTMVESFRNTMNSFNVLVWILIVACSAAMTATCHNDDNLFYALCAYLFVLTTVLFSVFFSVIRLTNTLIATVTAPSWGNRSDPKELHDVADRLENMKKYWAACVVSLVTAETVLIVLWFTLGAVPYAWAIVHLPALVLSVFAPLAVASLFPKTSKPVSSATPSVNMTASQNTGQDKNATSSEAAVISNKGSNNVASITGDSIVVSTNVTPAKEDIV
jgi:hypothetical protein